jgi:hypothetical protein
MLFQVIAIILLISILLAVWSLHRQTTLDELKVAKKDLAHNRVVFQRDSSKESSDLA